MPRETTTEVFMNDRDAAIRNKPQGDELGNKKLYCVTTHGDDDVDYFLWSDGYAQAAYVVIRYLGWSVSLGEKGGKLRQTLEASRREAEALRAEIERLRRAAAQQ